MPTWQWVVGILAWSAVMFLIGYWMAKGYWYERGYCDAQDAVERHMRSRERVARDAQRRLGSG